MATASDSACAAGAKGGCDGAARNVIHRMGSGPGSDGCPNHGAL